MRAIAVLILRCWRILPRDERSSVNTAYLIVTAPSFGISLGPSTFTESRKPTSAHHFRFFFASLQGLGYTCWRRLDNPQRACGRGVVTQHHRHPRQEWIFLCCSFRDNCVSRGCWPTWYIVCSLGRKVSYVIRRCGFSWDTHYRWLFCTYSQ